VINNLKFSFFITRATASTRPAQCYDYIIINDPTRSVNQTTGSNSDSSYFSTGPRWVRFEGAGGTQIPTSAPPIYRCGTSASGWYSGEIPSVSGTTVNGTVCYTWTSGNCAWRNPIGVTNCGSYYVYQLTVPPTGGLRYCTTNVTDASVASRSP
jgi:Notch-like protein